MPLRSSRRNYNRIADDGRNGEGESNALDEPLSPSSSFDDGHDGEGDEAAASSSTKDEAAAIISPTPPIVDEISVTLMDAAQSKFSIACDSRWKVSEFKEVSARVTKVPPCSQRLIHMGKLLRDDATLDECGIREDGKIIHLFPKPNVVINSSAAAGDQSSSNASNATGDESGANAEPSSASGGAHVPQIILDSEEASRRSQILILSSQEIFEAQHRVKIFSFLLMIISSMELLTLMTLFVGVDTEDPYGQGGGDTFAPPGNPTDAPPSNGGGGVQIRTWQNSDYFDTAISAFGFYVSLLGIKATTENTLQLARQYFFCLVLAGIGSNCYYYYLNIQAEQKHAQEHNQNVDSSELYSTAFVGILLPLTVWLLCIMRAYQFQMLIREAEEEAQERTLGGGSSEVGGASSSNGAGDEGGEGSRSLRYGSDDDLELAVERGVSS